MSRAIGLFAEQRFHQLLPRDAQVFGHVSEDRAQCADPKRSVTGNCDVVLALLCVVRRM